MSAATRPRFIDDLVPIILESTEHWWTRDYARLAQVSTSWLYYVRKRLYSCPTLYSFDSCAHLARSTRENPPLAQLITGVELRLALDECNSRATGEHFEGIRTLLGLENLQRLVIGGQLSRRAERFLNVIAFPETIVELVVDGEAMGDSCSSPSLELDESFVYRFPSLRTLKLANLELEMVPPPAPFPVPINHLILTNVDILGPLCQLISGSPLDLLSVQACSAYDYDEQLRQVLTTCEVKAIEYTVREIGHDGTTRSFLDIDTVDASSLLSLRLDGHIIDQSALSDLARCHRSLERLVVNGRFVRISAQEWADFITSRALPHLRELRLPGGTNRPPFAKWEPQDLQILETACVSSSVQLLV